MLHVTVTLLGRAAEAAGEATLEYALTPPACVGTVLELLGLRRPQVAALLPSCTFSVNGGSADTDTVLSDGDEMTIHSCN